MGRKFRTRSMLRRVTSANQFVTTAQRVPCAHTDLARAAALYQKRAPANQPDNGFRLTRLASRSREAGSFPAPPE